MSAERQSTTAWAIEQICKDERERVIQILMKAKPVELEGEPFTDPHLSEAWLRFVLQ